MKKIAWLLVFALFIQLIPVNVGTLEVKASETAGQSLEDNTVITTEYIPDETLLNCIKNNVGKTPDEAVTYGEIKGITNLSYPISVIKELGWAPIESLEGINILTDLYSLTVTGHNITDLTPLEEVENLTRLWANDNKISVMPDFSERSMSAFYVARNQLSLETLQSNLPSYFASSAEHYYTLQLSETPEVNAADTYYEVCDKNGNSYYPLTLSTSDLRRERTYTMTGITVDGKDVTDQFRIDIVEDYQAPEGMKVTVCANGGAFLTTMEKHSIKVELVDEYGEIYSFGTTFVLEPMQEAYVMEVEETEYISCTGVRQTGITIMQRTFMTKDSTVTVEKVELTDQEGTVYGSARNYSYYKPYGLYDYRYTDENMIYECSSTLWMLVSNSDDVCQAIYSNSSSLWVYEELPEGLYNLVFTLSDGTTYTYKYAYEAVSRPIVYYVCDTDDTPETYNTMYTDQTGDYVSIYVYGWNLTKDTVKPVFYNGNKEVISGDVKAVETDKWGAFFRIEKNNPNSEDWQIALYSSGTSGEKQFDVKIETRDESIEKKVYITRREIFYQYFDQRDKSYTVYFGQNADVDMTISPTLMFQEYDYNHGDYTSFITAEGGIFTEELNTLTGQKEIKAVFTLTDEQIALAKENQYNSYYAVEYANASGEARTFRSDYATQYAQGGYKVEDVPERGRVSGYNQTYFYLPYWIGNVYSIEENGENSYYLTEDDAATLSDGKLAYAEYYNDEETGAIEEKFNYRSDYYFWTVGTPIEAPVGTPELTVAKRDEVWQFSWTQVVGATYYDLVFRYGETEIAPFYWLETQRDIHPDELTEMFRMCFEECYWNPDESKMEVFIRPVAYKDGDYAYGTASNVFTVAELKSSLGGGHIHTEAVQVTKAQYGKNGSEVIVCSSCGTPIKSTTIYAPKTVAVSELIYNGKNQTPQVVVTDSQGKVIAASNYTVSTVKNVGSNKITIKFKGSSKYYTGTMTATAKVNPKGTKLSQVTGKKKSIVVKWKKMATQTKGYQIQYSTDKNFKKSVKTITIKKNGTTSTTIKKLKAKKKYYIRIRTYNGKCYSTWSKEKNVKTK